MSDVLHPWSFIADGDLNYGDNEDHLYGVKIGTGHYWCAGCLVRPPRYFTTDGHAGWPNLVAAPNGLMVYMRHASEIEPEDITRRPLCPKRGAL